MMNFYVLFDLSMAAVMLVFGVMFYRSDGKAAAFLTGYNQKPAKEDSICHEREMCRSYGKQMMYMAVPFLPGAIADVWFVGTGCLAAWGIWLVLFLRLLAERQKRER
ncbi:MAG: DUF3784 domain-containing protein [Lachnospiraceae bacterium]|nr:DUF3784 domain-containing protein [Lachnospiraceae bacterium]MCI9659198.1 DUF3784 domain-containing protein [Lachnospiraceae bacterium]